MCIVYRSPGARGPAHMHMHSMHPLRHVHCIQVAWGSRTCTHAYAFNAPTEACALCVLQAEWLHMRIGLRLYIHLYIRGVGSYVCIHMHTHTYIYRLRVASHVRRPSPAYACILMHMHIYIQAESGFTCAEAFACICMYTHAHAYIYTG